MGSWSATIMGGDTPYEIESIIYEKLGITKCPDVKPVDIKIQLEEKQDYLLKLLASKEYEWAEGEQLLILGYVMCSAGAKINQPVKDYMIQACDRDEWAQRDNERFVYVNQLKEAIAANDGTAAVEFPIITLGDRLIEYLVKEKKQQPWYSRVWRELFIK